MADDATAMSRQQTSQLLLSKFASQRRSGSLQASESRHDRFACVHLQHLQLRNTSPDSSNVKCGQQRDLERALRSNRANAHRLRRQVRLRDCRVESLHSGEWTLLLKTDSHGTQRVRVRFCNTAAGYGKHRSHLQLKLRLCALTLRKQGASCLKTKPAPSITNTTR
jgi:hypothetical protein